MVHVVEAYRQMSARPASGSSTLPRSAFAHADGGVLSSHVSLILADEEAA
jgi:hypothetical protein